MPTGRGLERLMRRLGPRRRLALAAAGLALVAGGIGFFGLALAEIRVASWGRTYARVDELPHAPVGLVLGCSPQVTGGRQNLYFLTRVQAAARLFHAGKVDYLLVSGDNHRRGYNEPLAFKSALMAQGVPAERIYCDYAGFRTLDSIVRAQAIFGQTDLTVVSQEFHNRRAIFLARNRGIRAQGYNAAGATGPASLRVAGREYLACLKAWLDVRVLGTKPKFFGPPIRIGRDRPV